MNFPLDGACHFSELRRLPVGNYEKGVGRIYLIEFDGRVKVGSSVNIAQRCEQHARAGSTYGIEFGMAKYSKPMKLVAYKEKEYHLCIAHLRSHIGSEIYKSNIDTLISLFFIKHEIAEEIPVRSTATKRRE
jgi:hypothetical protein